MKTGACLRCFTTRSSSPLPMIGSVLAVHVTTMSNSCSRCGSSFSVIACPPRRSASWLPRSSVRFATVTDFGFLREEMARGELDHLARADEQQALARDGREDALGELHAAAAIEIDALPMSVCVRTSFATANVRWNRRLRMRPSEPADSAAAHGLLHLPEDLRLAQHHRVEPARDAERMRHRLFVRQRVDVRRDRLLGQAVELREPRARRAPDRRRRSRPRCDCTSKGWPLRVRAAPW